MTGSSPDAQNRAISMMVLAILFLSLMDASVKALVPRTGITMTLWARYAGQMLLVLVIFSPHLKQIARTRYPGLQFFRSLLLMSTTGFYFVSLSRIPLSDAAALMAVNPVMITLGAAMFLGEALGLRRIIGIAVAMLGAMIIIRPGSDVFSPDALYALAAAASYSGYALVTRKVGPQEDPRTSLLYTGLVGTVILSFVVPGSWVTPDATSLGLIVVMTLLATAGQMALIRAFSQGEAAMLAPYSYVGLIFAATWGALFFSEWPDIWTISGALVIAGAGIYVWHRETRSR